MMENTKKAVLFLLLGIFLSVSLGWAPEKDKEGCKDHPLFTRMSNYYVNSCDEIEFDSFEFKDDKGSPVTVEGHKYVMEYILKEGAKVPSPLQIIRNFTNAIKKIGGTTYEQRDERAFMRLVKDGKETWAMVYIDWDGKLYRLTIVEKGGMVQEVVADAKTMAQDISTAGKVAIYGIYFDFNKADVKPESDSTLKEIAKLLSQNPNLKLYVVGHTDNVGGFDYNMKLSQARAEAVVRVLTNQYKVNSNRLKSHGVGPLAPVTSNKTEQGRAKNRRVELVEQ
jgi:outer membrane protein OmpA-like peptidoglycan-associated protein